LRFDFFYQILGMEHEEVNIKHPKFKRGKMCSKIRNEAGAGKLELSSLFT